MSAAGFDVVIVGGGAAGITVAAQLRRHRTTLSIALVEPSETHAYQPGWTMVGAGVFSMKQTQRRQETLIPPGVTWFRIGADAFEPERNAVILADGRRLTYASLVLCPGLQLDWNRIEGLQDALGANGVCSNYASAHAEYTWRCIQELDGGTALFTQPAMPIKCAGAPQKIMYLASDALRRTGRLDRVDVEFCLSGSVLFGVPFFVPALQRSIDEYGIRVNYGHTLTAVDGPARKAVFSAIGPGGQTREIVRDFDMLHVTPPQGPPDFIRNSPFADAAGWVSVDPETLQHTRFPNVFGLGDAAGTTNAKTAAAVRLQAPVVVRNLLAAVDGRSLTAAYDGYGSCPLTTAYGRVVLAEFGYGGRIMPSFPIDPRVPRFSAWLLKQNILPALYWNWMLKGSELDIRHRERTFEKAA
ncbi:NAD(P)/FAD-dependent oxidoreductase [Lichenicola cladoniae]|uniref:NAD(P)/FAD-dependent oxidoreductase n=1 Tax=Lichenicola cladoniae TaxID=1484109 RepID=A0A6M8HQ38_9PROT|nr:FAD/NAD(P)-binding oxidoreductase [Lichenicola cladoniae]NPD66384.1 NAD(P)/FAD-dependent oxidoreductase [Acetobacteraceae bacterium]QKE90375.1 NAD(P)/FAD-dependent oxidoreductase [Lichenicola cladoniae]